MMLEKFIALGKNLKMLLEKDASDSISDKTVDSTANIIVDSVSYMTAGLAAHFESLNLLLHNAMVNTYAHNPYFTLAMQKRAMLAIVDNYLDENKLRAWVKKEGIDQNKLYRNVCLPKIGIVMAGNIPLVGFHDFLCVLISGGKAVVKLSSKDSYLLPVLVDIMFNSSINENYSSSTNLHINNESVNINNNELANIDLKEISKYVSFVAAEEFEQQKLDGLLMMGGNVAASHFEKIFPCIPKLIRHNRFSCAMISGNETTSELRTIADDITAYYGMGCRSISYLFVPNNYDFTSLVDAIKYIIRRGTVLNSDFETKFIHRIFLKNSAVVKMQGEHIILAQNFFFIETKNQELVPLSIGFRYYESEAEVETFISENTENIQCFYRKLGEAQSPSLTDYPDGVNIIDYLRDLV
ncbi:MAG: acyl-CoA reductase [Bacteroidales bacterium]